MKNLNNNIDKIMSTEEAIKGVKSKVLNLIKEKKIKNKPKWLFVLNEIFFWIICGVLVIMASLTFSVFLHTLFDGNSQIISRNLGIGAYSYIGRSLFWISIFVFIAIIAYLDFIRTKRSHKYYSKVTHIVFALYIVLGSFFYYANTFEYLDKFFINNVPYYHEYIDTQMSLWSNPERGFLGGSLVLVKDTICIDRERQINRIIGDQNRQSDASKDLSANTATTTMKFQIMDFKDKIWDVDARKAVWHVNGCFGLDEKIKIVGRISDTESFEAKDIFRWRN